ncbi:MULTISPECIES: alpha/beta hydrolase [unclassified Bradyrhizobium]|uniref:alpha/beta hydrolase n=1 Tax=unclassified Bradyrhizobium TaxID=2631580 RepID=UPI0024B22256|nr:alpha/beta hydrolase [Bradyrhizobium sp. CB2312]WFU76116.1 alpha/beta hydrolase [Bradyrhizobium sp. CB2312]
MVGAVPNVRADTRADRTNSGRHGRALRIGLVSALVPLLLTLVQCGRAPNPAALAANSQANVQVNQVVAKTGPQASNLQVASGDTFEDRFPAPQFTERFPSASESFLQRQMSDFSPKRAVQQPPQPERASYKVASLEPQVPFKRPARDDLTTLVSMKSSAFPYFGNNPASDAPFLNISKGDRRGHRSYSGRVYWQDETYSDSRVLVHVPEHFDVRKPGVIVVFFHGNGATLERDVRDRQLVPQQITDSGANAVLLAPQMAVDAADSSAGKFWQAGGLKRFMEESAGHLARLTGDPDSARAFANMPIVIVGYSGGFLPTAWSLEVGGISDRVRGVVLLDAVYGEMDKFASWIESHRSGFFVSSYTHYTARRDRELMSMLRQKGISVSEDMDGPLRPGSVVFVETGEGITHRDYVTRAWTRDPLKDVLVKMSATPALALTRVASTNPAPSR